MKKEIPKRKDKFTSEWFTPKRSNQFFMNRKNQIDYNNYKASELRMMKAIIDKKLNKTYLTLKKLIGNQEEFICTYEFLKGAGVDLSVISNCKTINQKMYYCVYDIAYRTDDKVNFIIIKDNEYRTTAL